MSRTPSFPIQVSKTIDKYGMLAEGEAVLVGVSGGADSVALLRVLCELRDRPQPAWKLGVAHVNHRWRGRASDQDEAFVRRLAERLGLEVFVHRASSGPSGAGPGAEAAARGERWNLFDELCDTKGFDRIAVAHNREDRCETFLLNLVRGAGSDGLSAMRGVAGRAIRPLIESGREEIEAYLAVIGQEWRLDDTNRDTRFTRNRMRHEVFPALRRDFNPRLIEALSRTIDVIENEDRWMEDIVTAWLSPRVSRDGSDLVLEIGDLAPEPAAFVRRVLRSALRMAGSSMRDIGFDHIEALRSLTRAGKSGRTVELPGSIRAERSFDTLRFFPDAPPCSGYEYRLPIPGRIEVPEIGKVFEARLVQRDASEAGKPNGNRVFVDGESVCPYVKIRNWQNGDFYNPDGLPASKLKTLFQKGRIPRSRRRLWPVLVADSSIVWVASFPVSRDFVPTGRSRSVVELEASQLLR